MPEAFCFDMYGTLFDTQSVAAAVREHIDAPDPVVADLVELWRRKQLQYSYQVALMEAYEPFWNVTEHALEYSLTFYKIDQDAVDTGAILQSYEHLSPYDDAVAALDALSDRDVHLSILSNGNPSMLETLAANAGLDGYFEAIISADEVSTFKPAPAVYQNAAARLGEAIEDCWLISSNAWDVAGAAQAGMSVAWVNRANEPQERIGGEPTETVDTLEALPGLL